MFGDNQRCPRTCKRVEDDIARVCRGEENPKQELNRCLLLVQAIAIGIAQRLIAGKIARCQLTDIVPHVGDEHAVLPRVFVARGQRRIDAQPMKDTRRFPLRCKRDDLVVFPEPLHPRHRRGFLLPDEEVLERPSGFPQTAQHEFAVLLALHEIERAAIRSERVNLRAHLTHPLPIRRRWHVIIPRVVCLVLIERRIEKRRVYF